MWRNSGWTFLCFLEGGEGAPIAGGEGKCLAGVHEKLLVSAVALSIKKQAQTRPERESIQGCVNRGRKEGRDGKMQEVGGYAPHTYLRRMSAFEKQKKQEERKRPGLKGEGENDIGNQPSVLNRFDEEGGREWSFSLGRRKSSRKSESLVVRRELVPDIGGRNGLKKKPSVQLARTREDV